MNLPITRDEIAALSLEERFALAELLLDSVTTEPEQFELTEEWKAELERRSKAHDEAPGTAIPSEVVIAEARARAGR
jgi:putative addiction module component (TIGR02574 family)